MTSLLKCCFTLGLMFSLVTSALARRGAEPVSRSEKEIIPLADVVPIKVPAMDAAKRRAVDDVAGKTVPFQFADAHLVDISCNTDGSWDTLENGDQIWRMQVVAPGATDLSLGFRHYRLPPGATLHIYAVGEDYYEGPYTADDNEAHGEFWSPVIPGDHAVIELYVPPVIEFQPELRICQVNRGYRDVFRRNSGATKQGSCNNDVICAEGDPWRDEIRSVARYTINGMYLCTGSMIMDERRSFRNLFLTANHCDLTESSAPTVVVYWNYESPSCGSLSGGSFAYNQSGAHFRASKTDVDVALIELDDDPDPSWNVYYAGWDRSGTAANGSVCIHHPSGDEKSITFNTDVLTTSDSCIGTGGSSTHWFVSEWEDGTTEGGSSGSGLWDPDTHLIVGFLSGGLAACGNTEYDCFGKFSVAWNSGSSASTRLKDWLDPDDTGVMTVSGSDKEGIAPVLAAEPATTFSTSNTVNWTAGAARTPSGQSGNTMTGKREFGRGAVVRPASYVEKEGSAENTDLQSIEAKRSFDVGMDAKEAISVVAPRRGSESRRSPQAGWYAIKSEDFDGSWPNDWDLTGNYTYGGQPITWGPATFHPRNGSYAAWPHASVVDPAASWLLTAPGTPYVESRMTYGPFSLSDATDARVKFYVSYELGAGDSVEWYASVDGANWYGYNMTGGANWPNWTEKTFDLTSVPTLGNLCGQSSVYIRLAFTADDVQDLVEAAHVDDILIEKYTATDPADLQLAEAQRQSSTVTELHPFWVRGRVHNGGVATAGSSHAALYLSTDGDADTSDDYYVGEMAVGGLAASASEWVQWDFNIPNIGTGSYTVWPVFKVDSQGEVPEGDEGNSYNIGSSFTVGDAPAEYYVECDDNSAFTSPTSSGWTELTQWTFSGLTFGQSYWYRVKSGEGPTGSRIQSGWSNVESSQQIVPPAPAAISSHPTNSTVVEPNAVMFSVAATGDAPLSYQWRRGGSNIGSATNTEYTLDPTSSVTDHGATFDVVVSNPHGMVTSVVVTLTVISSDSDGDGIPDEWEMDHLSDLTFMDETTDFDQDGLLDIDELGAGTNPTNSNSVLIVESIIHTNASECVIRWQSASNRWYSVERTEDLLSGFGVAESNIVATPPQNTWTDLFITAEQYLYRVVVVSNDLEKVTEGN